MNPMALANVAVLVLALVAGCGDTGVDEVACTTEARHSVVVRVVDVVGVPLAGATVTYRVDGGPVQTAECLEPLQACTVFVAGSELAGQFAIRAERPGFVPATASATVLRDVCHVVTRELVMALAAA